MKALYIIPARGGSKGIPHKNIKPLAGKPLIMYSIDVARALAADTDICVSTDDEAIAALEAYYHITRSCLNRYITHLKSTFALPTN